MVALLTLSLLARHYRLPFGAGFALCSCNEVRHGEGWCEHCHNTNHKEKIANWKGQASHLHSALSKEWEPDMRFFFQGPAVAKATCDCMPSNDAGSNVPEKNSHPNS